MQSNSEHKFLLRRSGFFPSMKLDSKQFNIGSNNISVLVNLIYWHLLISHHLANIIYMQQHYSTYTVCLEETVQGFLLIAGWFAEHSSHSGTAQ